MTVPDWRKGIAVPANVPEMAALENLVAEAKKQLGRVDILVNNAATSPVLGPVVNKDERAFDIAPGLIQTDFSRALWDNENAGGAGQVTPPRRICEPNEMAGQTLMLGGRGSA